jgi:dethiobiotin synthetase
MRPIFITGIGTDVGKTVVASILAEALEADYWKPVQAGLENGTDSEWVKSVLSRSDTRVHKELYRLRLPASPHIAAREEGIRISIPDIIDHCSRIQGISRGRSLSRPLVLEGAGGLMVPLNEKDFVLDLVEALGAEVILVSRNYLGSINHSLLTASVCRSRAIRVAGWVFNDQFMDYEDEIVSWSGYPKIAAIPFRENPEKRFVREQAEQIRDSVKHLGALT